jgi:hypothetical protein
MGYSIVGVSAMAGKSLRVSALLVTQIYKRFKNTPSRDRDV